MRTISSRSKMKVMIFICAPHFGHFKESLSLGVEYYPKCSSWLFGLQQLDVAIQGAY